MCIFNTCTYVHCAYAEEYNIYLTGLIPSQFIYALDMKDMALFRSVLWMSAVTVISVSIVSVQRFPGSFPPV